MSFIRVPTELLQANITPTQFKLCAFIISNSVYNKESEVCACFWGYGKIAKEFTGDPETSAKSSIIKQIKDLVNKGILVIYERESNKSNGIAFNEDFELGRAQTDVGCLNNTDGCLNITDGCLNNTLHKDNRFKNIYLKNIQKGCLNNTQENKQNSKDIEAANMVAARSMPAPDKSGGDQQEKDCAAAQLDIVDLELVEQLRAYLIGLPFAKLYRSKDFYIITANSSLSYQQIEKVFPEMEKAAAEIGRRLELGRKNTVYINDIIIDFQQLIK